MPLFYMKFFFNIIPCDVHLTVIYISKHVLRVLGPHLNCGYMFLHIYHSWSLLSLYTVTLISLSLHEKCQPSRDRLL